VWVGEALAAKTCSLRSEGGALVFTVEGRDKQMVWRLALRDDEMAGDDRYLLVRYKAEGLNTAGGNYFLHGVEGTPGGRLYAWDDEVVCDGAWHVLAVDLLQVNPQEPTSALAFKVIVGDTGPAKLTVDRIWFAGDLPAGAKVARAMVPPAASVVFDWSKVELKPQPAWTLNPATDFSATVEGTAATFVVRGAGKAMRWPLAMPTPVDLAATPYVSLRYKASGRLGLATYAIWLGDDVTGAAGHSAHPLLAGDLKADGAWHNFTVRLGQGFRATQLAAGLDCGGDEATMTLDTITFGSAPPMWPLAQMLPYDTRAEAWPAGRDGLTVLPLKVTGGRPSAFLQRRLEVVDWFSSPRITVDRLPFDVAEDPAKLPQTGTAELGALATDLPPAVREVCLLTAGVAPPNEPWGIDPQHPRPQEFLSEPEKVVCEVRYAKGPPDFVLPLSTETGKWGLKRGLGVHVVHPDPKRQATQLLLHDRMQTASFAIVGVTVNTGTPRVAEPTWEPLSYPPPPAGRLAGAGRGGGAGVVSGGLEADFTTGTGLSWARLSASGMANALSVAPGALFEVEMGGKTLPGSAWSLVGAEPLKPMGKRYVLRSNDAGLTATVDCLPGGTGEILLRMDLHNDSPAAVTATLRFPVLREVRFGSAADTWYLCGKRGGVINSAPMSTRDALGDPHPLQVDGFFNPRSGLALACLTHDTVAQHHFIRFAKSANGGEWAPEYVERDLAPGATFTATEAALVLREGDWRAIFAAYRDWLKTWYKPPQPKPWWNRTFAFLGCSAHYDGMPDPKRRGDVQHLIDTGMKYLGVCDYVHLFGWSSSKQYGDWGDYDHYDETVGGLDYFRGNIAKAQAAGIGVGLYQDGYLNCGKGQFSGAHAKEWAMKRADQSPQYIPEYDAYNECPTIPAWQEYLSDTYGRIHRDLGTKGLYVDEYGGTDARWLCQAKDHGHNGYEVPYAGEVAMLKRLRAAVGPEVALYSEYPGAEVERTILDGSFTYQALWSVDQEPLAPHFIDLPRFAFSAFKQFHIIYYVTPRAGNWWLLKYPFFNGESYCIGEPGLPYFDAAAMAFQRRAVTVLCAHREAFSSESVEPLVNTGAPGVFANLFRGPRENVWTLYNANGHSARGPLLRVKHFAGASYEDAWLGKPLTPRIEAGQALIAVELGPKAVGCVVQRRP
jgi:hypothetical protein